MQFFLYRFIPFLDVIGTFAFLYTIFFIHISGLGIFIKLFVFIIYSILVFNVWTGKMLGPIWMWKILLWFNIFQLVIIGIILPLSLQTFPDLMLEVKSEPDFGYSGLVSIYIGLVPSMIMQFLLLIACLFDITPKIKKDI